MNSPRASTPLKDPQVGGTSRAARLGATRARVVLVHVSKLIHVWFMLSQQR